MSTGVESLFDVAIIGAGPAGLSAATAALEYGARVVLIDEAERPGGQYWRHRKDTDPQTMPLRSQFTKLMECTTRRDGTFRYLSEHAVWRVQSKGEGFWVDTVHGKVSTRLRAVTVVLATGAYERQVPFPGWTLPGVVGAGAAQAMLKSSGVVLGRRILVAGTGPFLLPVAVGLSRAGADVVKVVEAASPLAFAKRPLTLMGNIGKLSEGARYMRTLHNYQVPYETRTIITRALGSNEVEGAQTTRVDGDWKPIAGTARTVECDTIAIGYGFTPQAELALQMGCGTRVDRDGSLVIKTDVRQASTVSGAFIAGEASGIGGAQLAIAEGHIAGSNAALASKATSTCLKSPRLYIQRLRLRAFARGIQETFTVKEGWKGLLENDTVICRCEEVSLEEIEFAVRTLGASDTRSVKLLARPGMGLCQGRICGNPTASLVASYCGRAVDASELVAMTSRPVARKVTLGMLADS